jgi:MFS family permease
MIAGFFRSFGNMAISAYLPVFFQKVYPQFTSEYSILSALSLMTFGFSSVMLGGILCDKYEKKNYMTNALICMFGALAAIPMVILATLNQGNFYFSMVLASLTILVSGSYFAPAVTMMQKASSKENAGNVVSMYTFVTTVAQTISPIFFSYFAGILGVVSRPSLYGPMISAFITFGYACSSIFYWKAGKSYKKFMQDKDMAENQAILMP